MREHSLIHPERVSLRGEPAIRSAHCARDDTVRSLSGGAGEDINELVMKVRHRRPSLVPRLTFAFESDR